jgi:hypothetical protein
MTAGPPPRLRRRGASAAVALAAMVVALGVLVAPDRPALAAATCPTAMAHRGNAYSPGPTESSIGAFNAAFSSGSKWI